MRVYSELEGYHDIAEILVSQYYAAYLPMWLQAEIEPSDILESLKTGFEPDDLIIMMQDNFERGILLGYILASLTIKDALDEGEEFE